jgi:hypothetical protein
MATPAVCCWPIREGRHRDAGGVTEVSKILDPARAPLSRGRRAMGRRQQERRTPDVLHSRDIIIYQTMNGAVLIP